MNKAQIHSELNLSDKDADTIGLTVQVLFDNVINGNISQAYAIIKISKVFRSNINAQLYACYILARNIEERSNTINNQIMIFTPN